MTAQKDEAENNERKERLELRHTEQSRRLSRLVSPLQGCCRFVTSCLEAQVPPVATVSGRQHSQSKACLCSRLSELTNEQAELRARDAQSDRRFEQSKFSVRSKRSGERPLRLHSTQMTPCLYSSDFISSNTHRWTRNEQSNRMRYFKSETCLAQQFAAVWRRPLTVREFIFSASLCHLLEPRLFERTSSQCIKVRMARKRNRASGRVKSASAKGLSLLCGSQSNLFCSIGSLSAQCLHTRIRTSFSTHTRPTLSPDLIIRI